MSRGDLSPHDLDLGSGRVHTHSQAEGFLERGAARAALEKLKSVICLSFSAIYDYRIGSPAWGYTTESFLISIPGHLECRYSEDTFFYSAVWLRRVQMRGSFSTDVLPVMHGCTDPELFNSFILFHCAHSIKMYCTYYESAPGLNYTYGLRNKEATFLLQPAASDLITTIGNTRDITPDFISLFKLHLKLRI